MKGYFTSIFPILAAIGLSAFKSYDYYLTVDANDITFINVTSESTYSTNSISCFGDSETPCILDLTQINPAYWVNDRASFLAYLLTKFPTPGARVSEVNRITIEWKN